MTKHEFDQQSATLCARMAASSNKGTREQAARTFIARVESEASITTESIDGDWRVVSDGTLAVRVNFTHREKAVEYRLLFIEDHPWIGSPFQGAEFGLDAEDAWRRVSAWLDES